MFKFKTNLENKLVAASSLSQYIVDCTVELDASDVGAFLLLLAGAPSRAVLFPRVHARKALGDVPKQLVFVSQESLSHLLFFDPAIFFFSSPSLPLLSFKGELVASLLFLLSLSEFSLSFVGRAQWVDLDPSSALYLKN